MLINTSNIATKIGCEELIRESLNLGPVGGIFNLAVVLRDSILENQDAEKFIESLAPKATATRFLDELSRSLCPNLHLFVVFSSASCGRGTAGQSNYGMANSIMERIIEQRHKDGLPGKAVQYGAVGQVGLVAAMQEEKIDLEIGGTLPQRISSCIEVLDTLLTIDDPVTSSMVVAEKRSDSFHGAGIIDAIVHIMGIKDAKMISATSTMAEIGMDSLMIVEIQQFLIREHKVDLTSQELRTISIGDLRKRCEGEETIIVTMETEERVNYLFTSFGDEENGDYLILKLDNFANKNSKIKALILPGIEGVSEGIWQSVAKLLKYPTYILQYANAKKITTVDDIIEYVKKVRIT